ncbi:hypothetical protein [Eleftheria terrae]|uniref:hypothetical protein n=1 Tax=Eleftheria terrae TaxID=1597781 RepID=UPI00263BA033|nr:hypothetical protein [Eleftheria terrae]WKB53103.1 hypothetical protein N7L95_01470 [Eleftheria terrae]
MHPQHPTSPAAGEAVEQHPSPMSRRHLLLGTASCALLAACGGGGHTGSEAASDAGTAPAAGSDASATGHATAEDWQSARDTRWQEQLARLKAQKYVTAASARLDDVVKAIQRAVQDKHYTVLLPAGDTWLEDDWNPAALVPAGQGPLTLFTEGRHAFTGKGRLKLDRAMRLYNCWFRQRSPDQVYAGWVNGLVLQFNRFTDPAPKSQALRLHPVGWDRYNKVDFQWNDIGGIGANGQPAPYAYGVYAADLRDSVLSHNRIRLDGRDEIKGRCIWYEGGWNNQFVSNYIDGGFIGITAVVMGLPQSTTGQNSHAPNQSHLDNLIQGNTLRNIVEESISYDAHAEGGLWHPVVDVFDLARVGGSEYGKTGTPERPAVLVPVNPNLPKDALPFSEKLYQDYFVVWNSGPLTGKYAQIWKCTLHDNGRLMAFWLRSPRHADNLVLKAGAKGLRLGELTQEDFTLIANNHKVSIGAVAANIRIEDNLIYSKAYSGKNTTAIGLWGTGLGFRISGNQIIDEGGAADFKSRTSISVTHVGGVSAKTVPETYTGPDGQPAVREVFCGHGTQTRVGLLVGHSVVEKNEMGQLPLRITLKEYGGYGDYREMGTSPMVIRDNTGVPAGQPVFGVWGAGGPPTFKRVDRF